jgi:hypothetical protein
MEPFFIDLFINNNNIYNYDESNAINILDNDLNNNLNENCIYKLFGWRLFNFKNSYIHPIDCNINDNMSTSLDFKYNNIPIYIKEEYLQIIKELEIQPIIINNVSNFIGNNLNTPYLSVHIRTWMTFNSFEDNRSSYERYSHYNKNIFNFITAINDSPFNLIFIATDNKTEIQHILDNIINKKIIFYERNPNLNSLQNDFSELLILSKGSSIIGSYISTFTEMAWWYSGCIENIIII